MELVEILLYCIKLRLERDKDQYYIEETLCRSVSTLYGVGQTFSTLRNRENKAK